MTDSPSQTPTQTDAETRTDTHSQSPPLSDEEKPCVVCEMYPVEDTEPTLTTNRSLLTVNTRVTIEPVCEEHDTEPVEEQVERAYDKYGVHFVADAISHGVFTKNEVYEHLSEDEHDTLDQAVNESS